MQEKETMMMPILQYYYTSFINKVTGSAGFQVKAMAQGITLEQQLDISRLIAYRIPSSLDEREISTHPVALRYLYKDIDECFLLCSQSNGNDGYGRPGNFFAHVLVLEPGSFKYSPPVLYWKSEFWCNNDPLTRSELPVLLYLDEDLQSLDIEEVWSFLSSKERLEQLRKLMCAVVHSSSTQRRIVIIDTDDDIALWVAAVSMMLPPDYRPLLSFATYHHDPYQVPFLITGTTKDSFFRATPEEYLSYFILNTQTGMMSDVEDSLYANLITQCANPHNYELDLLLLFARYAHLFPPINIIDERLDQIALFAKICTSGDRTNFTTNEKQTIRNALLSYEHLQEYTFDDTRELLNLTRLLREALRTNRTRDDYELYVQAQSVLIQHFSITDESIIEVLEFFTESLLDEQTPLSDIVPIFEKFNSLLKNDLLETYINSQEYLAFLYKQLDKPSALQLRRIWHYLGVYLLPNPYSRELLLKSLRLCNKLWHSNHGDAKKSDGDKLFLAIKRAMKDQELNWLELIFEGKTQLSKQPLEDFYCRLVQDIELDKRIPYRNVLQKTSSDIIVTEFLFDIEIELESPKNVIISLERWSIHMKRYELEPQSLAVSHGLPFLESRYSLYQWQVLASKILKSNELAPLPPDVETKLITSVFAGFSLHSASVDEMTLYKKYYEFLSENAKTIIDALIAMIKGYLDRELVARLNAYLESLPREMYQIEIERFISKFLKSGVTKENHDQMVFALFVLKYNVIFWIEYFKWLSHVLTNPHLVRDGINILSIWFNLTPDKHFLWRYNIIQEFFLRLPKKLLETHEILISKGYSTATLQELELQSWYPSIQLFLPRHKDLLSSIRQGILPRQRPETVQNQYMNERAWLSKRKKREKVAELFEGSHYYEYHKEKLVKVYSMQQREQFWGYYWGELEQILTPLQNKYMAYHANKVLNLLTFWFVESFDSVEQVPYIIQEFFIGLQDVLDKVRTKEHFHVLAQEINAICEKQESHNAWYDLLKKYFV